MKQKRPISIDLFCGVGGMTLGFEQAGFDVVAAFDLEQWNIAAHTKNLPQTKAFALDLSKTSGKVIREQARIGNRTIDVLFGGPPCQGFSVGGKRDLDDERNLLVYEFSRLVRELNPRYFVMENVRGLLLDHARPVLESFLRRIKRAGYAVVEPIALLDAADFGVPQRRHRTFILGYRKGLAAPSYPTRRPMIDESGKEYKPVVRDAIFDLPDIEQYEDLFDTDVFNGELDQGSHYSRLMRGLVRDDADHSYPRKAINNRLTGCLRTQHSTETRTRFAATPPGGSEPISRYIRLDLNKVAPTIRAGTGADHGSHTAPRPIHPTAPRCISTREAARLHSFPDWFEFHGTRWYDFRQIGNAVPPSLARAVAKKMLDVCES
jgi:DNA (cytosine-5)-methyltransferase 1